MAEQSTENGNGRRLGGWLKPEVNLGSLINLITLLLAIGGGYAVLYNRIESAHSKYEALERRLDREQMIDRAAVARVERTVERIEGKLNDTASAMSAVQATIEAMRRASEAPLRGPPR